MTLKYAGLSCFARGRAYLPLLNRLVWLLAVVILAASSPQPAAALDFKLDVPLVIERAKLAAGHMAASETPTGSFVYEHDFAAGGAGDGDNMVRQAGAGFALAQHLAHTADLSHASRVRRALEFYERQSLAFGMGQLVASDRDLASATPGATALVLLTELFYFEATGDGRFAVLREAWLRGLEALWLPQGGFARAPGIEESSPYYDGEAWLALAHYHRLVAADPVAAALLEKADRYALSRYSQSPDLGFMHWGLMAAAIRHQTTGDHSFLAYSAELAEFQIDELSPHVFSDTNACYMVEGLAAAAGEIEGVPAYAGLLRRIAARIEAELSKSLHLQILPGQTEIHLGPGRFLYDEALYEQAGAFLNGRHALRSRIDFTQHCLSALMRYEAWQKRREG